MRVFIIVFYSLIVTFVHAAESENNPENRCEKAVNEKTKYRVSGIYGSSLESEWHPSAAFVLLKEMQRFKVLLSEFRQKTAVWHFEFAELVGGKTIVFVFHRKIQIEFCNGPNAFFVLRK